jgi:diguanylate cyclase (GGDEF)-like protein
MLEKALQSSLILIDIDNFKTINDLYGTDVGNFVLQKFAKFLQYNQPQDSEIYRIGSDDFAILNFQHFSEEKLLSVINNLTHKISEYYIFHDALDIDIDINVTMGISHEKKKSLESADIALKEAKEHGKNYIFYSEEINHKKIYEKDIQWAKLIKYAIKSNNIFPMFQPIVNSDGKTIKYESLMRIKESGTVFSPFHFIPIAKKTKQYTKLTILMLNHVFDQIGRCEVPISINLSVLDILDQEIVDYILTRLKDGGENVIFELVESESFENIEEVSHFIQQVKALGSRIAIDDFGTGYSNFSYLLQLEPDFIKIDGSLIKNIDHDKNSRIVTETVVDFANKLGIETIAEFVHSEEVFETVKAIGVSQFQGYYFSEPKEII